VLVVVLESATPAVTAALARVDAGTVEVVAERVTVDARAHAELLAPAVQAVLAEGGVKPGALDAIVAGLGPGPFTGLRVGLVTASALSQALRIPAYGVCSLDALGWRQPGRTLAATDARRRETYWAVYDDGRRVEGPAVDTPAAVVAGLRADRAVGDGAFRYAMEPGMPAPGEPRFPPAEALVALAADRIRAGAAGEPLIPLYLRRPDATLHSGRKSTLQ
jgi:tRNA threonylcarbamoyl adenosine modification protein YeaZ